MGAGPRDIEPLDSISPLEEDQDLKDRTPGVHRDHRPKDRVEIVLLAENEPAVDFRVAHRLRQNLVETSFQETIDNVRPLTDWKDPRKGRERRHAPSCVEQQNRPPN